MWYSTYGYRPYFLAMMKYPDVIETLFRYSGEQVRLRNKALASAIKGTGHIPLVYLGEDICYNEGPMAPVKLLREVYFPHLRRSMEPLKEAGIRIIWHSDGNIMPIVEDVLDCGVDGFQGFQHEAGTTLDKLVGLRSKAGRKLILFGSISVTATLPFGSVADVKAEVERCMDTAAGAGPFFLAPSSSVGPEVPDENIMAMFRHAVEYGTKIRPSG
jgi:uroporphyrinogen decarboxylase